MKRRSFLVGLVTLATPAIVRAESIWIPPPKPKSVETFEVVCKPKPLKATWSLYESIVSQIYRIDDNTFGLALPPPEVDPARLLAQQIAWNATQYDKRIQEAVTRALGITFDDKAVQADPSDRESTSLSGRLQRRDESLEERRDAARLHRD